MYEINICHLYPDLLNIYGDRGNIISLKKRCHWRGIKINVFNISINDPFVPELYDIIFIGGGQDYEQEIIKNDFIFEKGNEVKNAINNNKVFLCICGGYQLMGNFYKTWDGKEINFLGALDLHTIGSKERLIGNFLFECDFLTGNLFERSIVGFENHSGRTYLGPSLKPLGRVLAGGGNNGEDQTEGAVYKNVYCSYSHGSLLPKNPRLADHLIYLALKEKYRDFVSLQALDDNVEEATRKELIKRFHMNFV
jgi:CobQ-like glutamine amidotransferase family enzyme